MYEQKYGYPGLKTNEFGVVRNINTHNGESK